MTTHSQLGRHSTLRCTPSLPALSLHRAALYSRTTSHGDAQRASRLVPVAAAAPGGRGGAGGGDAADDNRLLQAAQRDPVSFLGGVFAGFLALSLDQDPLRSWVQQTSADAGVKYEATLQRLEQERAARGSGGSSSSSRAS